MCVMVVCVGVERVGVSSCCGCYVCHGCVCGGGACGCKFMIWVLHVCVSQLYACMWVGV